MKIVVLPPLTVINYMDNNSTVARSSSVAVKRRSRVVQQSNQNNGHSTSALDRLNKAVPEDAPPYVKTIMDALTETRRELAEVKRRSEEILEENKRLREENAYLKARLDELLPRSNDQPSVSTTPPSHVTVTSDPDLERSVVIRGVPENYSNSTFDRTTHDYSCVNTLLNFLGVECFPKAVYRMGSPRSNSSRLLKVVLPTSRFQKEVIKRKAKLRYSSYNGVFIRSSLTKEERDRRREQRLTGQYRFQSQNDHVIPSPHNDRMSQMSNLSEN